MLAADAPPLLTGLADAEVRVSEFFDALPWLPRALDPSRLAAGDFLRALDAAGGPGSPPEKR